MVEKVINTITNSRNRHAVILALLGIILLVLGEAIINVSGMPLRGSGAGTLFALAGVLMLIIAFIRFFFKRPK